MMTIDRICEMTKHAELLNALHACRPGHPWNKTAVRPWTNAWWLACQRPYPEISAAALWWLEQQAKKEPF